MLVYLKAVAGPLLIGGVLFYLLVFGGVVPDVVDEPRASHPAVLD